MPEIALSDGWGVAAIALGLFLGGVLKGATGVGMPVIAVPVIAAFYDVRLAVVVLVIPNFLINLYQVIKFRDANEAPKLTRNFALAGVAGAAVGTWALAWAPVAALNIALGLLVLGYIALRLLRPDFSIPVPQAERLAWWAGAGGGVLQGTLGISAPIAATFANSVRMARPAFILMVSVFFAAMCLAQLPVQLATGLMTGQLALLGALALAPLMLGMSVGDWLGKRMDAVLFDRAVLLLLAALAVRQILSVLMG